MWILFKEITIRHPILFDPITPVSAISAVIPIPAPYSCVSGIGTVRIDSHPNRGHS